MVANPQENGQVEPVKNIKSILKELLEKANGKWVNERHLVLWAC